jgi:hypothetical protein
MDETIFCEEYNLPSIKQGYYLCYMLSCAGKKTYLSFPSMDCLLSRKSRKETN